MNPEELRSKLVEMIDARKRVTARMINKSQRALVETEDEGLARTEGQFDPSLIDPNPTSFGTSQ